MAKTSDRQPRKNAIRGAITTWCPNCKRKAALGQSYAGWRTCRYCGYLSTHLTSKRRQLYDQWQVEKIGEQDGRKST